MHKGTILASKLLESSNVLPNNFIGVQSLDQFYACKAKVRVPKKLAILFPIKYGISIYLQNINSTDFVNKLKPCYRMTYEIKKCDKTTSTSIMLNRRFCHSNRCNMLFQVMTICVVLKRG